MLSSFDTEYTSPLCVPRLMRNTAFPTPLFFSLSRASARTFSSYPHLSFLWMIRYLYMNSCQLSLPTSIFSSLSALLANQRLSFPLKSSSPRSTDFFTLRPAQLFIRKQLEMTAWTLLHRTSFPMPLNFYLVFDSHRFSFFPFSRRLVG